VRRPWLLAAIFLLIGVSGFSSALGQSRDDEQVKSIRGRVLDLAGNAVEGARVFIFAPRNSQTRTLRTDEDGVYGIYGLPSTEDYEVRVTYQDAESETRLVSGLLSREDNIVNFTLEVVTQQDQTSGEGLSLETFDGVELYAAFDIPEGVQAPIPVALLLHGYGEDHTVWAPLRERLLQRGWAVLALDLRGHGQSLTRGAATIRPQESWRTDSQQFPLDLQPALDYLRTRPRLDSNRIAVIGFDVGAQLALIASERFREVSTAVAIDPNLDQALSMAGTARAFAPRTTFIVAAPDGEGERVREAVSGASRLTVIDPAPPRAQTGVWLDADDLVEQIVRWLRDTY
jgi:pimeloyl-ACP methyl ester carboxylesterase